ncbi:MAG TPA: glycoside hydrolase family 3 N-terminal domain-containing protein [Acidimicrobiia bacterium]|nr:glycoside hydrolase family 3 N-terminal domain-containing protein [Acidimicrobiia bacterium]
MTVADPHLMLAFEGTEVPAWLEQRLEESPPAGVTLFREWNMSSPGQVAELTTALQEMNSSPLPLLIAVDQEGGQLIGLEGSTPFSGNMALGATDDADLAEAVAAAMGRELAAVGINVNYAPVADVATQADNPSLGIRSFGEDPGQVARFVGAMVAGFSTAGVHSTAKHFPGKGEARVDPHYELPLLDLDRDRLDTVELPPFRAAFEAGAELLMMGHYVVPSITGSRDLPISASERGINGFVRQEMGFDGLVITDALDMGALDQGPAQVVEIITMMRGGTDLLLCMPDPALQDRVRTAVERGASRGLIPEAILAASRQRIERLRESTAGGMLRPELVGSEQHLALAAELAEKSVTVVRNDDGLLPLRLTPESRILALEPQPTNVTPADTTALYPPSLADALRKHHQSVTGIVYPHEPERSDVDSSVTALGEHDLAVVGTVAASRGQANLVRALLDTGKPVVTVALRTPYDLGHYPGSGTHLCTFSGHQPSLVALASVLFEGSGGRGVLPVSIPGLHPRGHGLPL